MSTTVTASSSYYDPSYSRNNVVSAKLAKIGNSSQYITEFFSINIIRLLRSVTLNRQGTIGSVPLPTQSWKLYGNTTAYWLIAVVNGFGSYLAIPDSLVIGYPDISIINNLTNISAGVNLNQSNVTI